jgi:hypothetical protein
MEKKEQFIVISLDEYRDLMYSVIELQSYLQDYKFLLDYYQKRQAQPILVKEKRKIGFDCEKV